MSEDKSWDEQKKLKEARLSGFKKFISNVFGIKAEEIHIKPESLGEHDYIKALKFENAEIKGKNDRLQLEYEKLRKSTASQTEENEVKIYLNEEKDRLERTQAENFFSFKKFFYKCYQDPEFYEKLFYTDFDRGTNLDHFKDIGLTKDGSLVVAGDNGVLIRHPDPKQIFQSISGLNNDISSGKIPLWLDNEGKWFENILSYEYPELKNASGKVYYKVRRKPIFDIVNEKNEIIQNLKNDLEEQEDINAQLQQENDDLRRALRINEKSLDSIQSNLSENEKVSSNVTNAMNKLLKRLEQERNKNVIIEDNIDQLEEELLEMRDKAERAGLKTSDDRAMDLIKDIRRELVKDEPQQTTRIIEVPSMKPQNRVEQPPQQVQQPTK